MRRILLAAFAALAFGIAADSAPTEVAVRLKWEYRSMAPAMKVYAVAPGAKATLWKTGSVGGLAELPLGEELTDRPVSVTAGGSRRLILVYENRTAAPVYFFAAPHHAEPEESALGFQFKCLCVNHAFDVSPGRFWFRVVELRVAPGFQGRELALSHTLIGIDEARRREFSGPPEVD